MGENQVVFKKIQPAPNKFDTVIEWVLAALLVFMPLLFGARNAWTEEVVVVLSGCILICFLFKIIFDLSREIVWSWAYVAVGLFVVIAAIQLVALPTSLIEKVSPQTVNLRTELLGDLPRAEKLLKSMPISLYPNGTKHDLRIVLSVAAVFFVVLNVFRQPKQIKRLLMIIALTGGFVAFIAMAQDIFGNGLRYWFVPHPYYRTRAISGPFINHNHYGQFMNLSIGAALGWFCVTIHERFSGKHLKLDEILDYLGSHSARGLWFMAAMTSIGAASVFISLTRGGMVSMLAAAVFTILLLVSRKSLAGHGWVMAATALVAFVCILYVGFDAVYDRFATLRNFEGYEFRWQTLKDLSTAFVHFPFLGTGLGTHSVVYPMYQNINTTLLFTHAENEYAQTIEETGLSGLVTLIVFGIIVWSSYIRNIRTVRKPIYLAAYGLGFGLLAILIHSLSDYGQHIPANAFLSAIFCALLISLAGQKGDKALTAKPIIPSRKSRFLRIIALLGVCGVWLWVFIGANNARIAEANWKKALHVEKGLVAKDWKGNSSEYADLISYAAAASEYQPDNVKYRYWLNVYRWYSVTKTNESDVENAASSELLIPFARDIVGELNKAIILCPTYGPSYSLAGQIEKFVLYDDAGAKKIRKGFKLAPCDPEVCFIAGQLDVLEGKTEDSIAKFEKAVKINRGFFKDIVNIYINHLSRPDLAILAAGDSVNRLEYVAGVLENMQYYDLAERCRAKAKEVLEIACSRPEASAANFVSLAAVYRRKHANEKAIECYRRALEMEYGQVHWRYSLARLLAESNKIPEALHEARICVRLRPQFKEAERLVADLSVNPASFDGKID